MKRIDQIELRDEDFTGAKCPKCGKSVDVDFDEAELHCRKCGWSLFSKKKICDYRFGKNAKGYRCLDCQQIFVSKGADDKGPLCPTCRENFIRRFSSRIPKAAFYAVVLDTSWDYDHSSQAIYISQNPMNAINHMLDRYAAETEDLDRIEGWEHKVEENYLESYEAGEYANWHIHLHVDVLQLDSEVESTSPALNPGMSNITLEFGPASGQFSIAADNSSGCFYNDVYTISSAVERVRNYLDSMETSENEN